MAFSKTALYAGMLDVPPLVEKSIALARSVTVARKYWLQHPDLFATEFRIRPKVGSIVATRKAAPT